MRRVHSGVAGDARSPPDVRDRPVTYANAGVDIEAADRSVGMIAARVGATHGPEVLGGIGGFGGLFRFDPGGWRDPVLVSSTDGVGTKIEIARRRDVLEGLGQDLVGMVVDDIVAVGARPLFMNDYLAIGRIDPDRVARLVGSIADACGYAGCALVGGETAEHPGIMDEDAFDLAGFAVGVVERDDLLGAHRVRPGDALIGLPSSGLHANGYSLVRRIVDGLDLEDDHGLGRPLGEELLEPTRIHAPDVLALIDALGTRVHAACHVTGGGLPGNLPRVLPTGVLAEVDASSWDPPRIFRWLADRGPVELPELRRTFNCGVGMVAIVDGAAAGAALDVLADRHVAAWVLGRVVADTDDARPSVRYAAGG